MLDKILKTGGIPSICSAHPIVLREILRNAKDRKVLIESTCNQVNQFGGYTGMNPDQFIEYVRNIAVETDFPVENLILGGDHLGPNVWQNEPADSAMSKSVDMVRAYVRAGYTKIHLDCSMRLANDLSDALDPEIVAMRAAQLAYAAEDEFSRCNPESIRKTLRYVIGTEVPVPGGALAHEEGVHVTRPVDVQQTIDTHRKAFFKLNLQKAWERVIAVVVQPGVEFGDDFVLAYQPEKAKELSGFIESQGLVYEAHSTDYQTRFALKNLVNDYFAILKVGPGLTFAYREAIFALAMIENELFNNNQSSQIVNILDSVMVNQPNYWQKYYSGTAAEQAFKRKFSLSDRIRYYWVQPEVNQALAILMKNMSSVNIPISLISQFASEEKSHLLKHNLPFSPENIISSRIMSVMADYWYACAVEKEVK